MAFQGLPGFDERAGVPGVPVGQAMNRSRGVLHVVNESWDAGHGLANLVDVERWNLHHFAVGVRIPEQPQRPGCESRREDEAVPAHRERGEEVAHQMAESGEVLEGTELEHFVEQERGGRAGLGACTGEEGERRVERLTRRRSRQRDIGSDKRRIEAERAVKVLRRGRRPFEVDVLTHFAAHVVADVVQHGRAAADRTFP